MWNKKNQMRNCFLQRQLPNYKAEIVNNYIFNEFSKISHASYAILDSKSIQPIKSKVLGNDRINLAYGFSSLPKLIEKVCSDDSRTQITAMNRLSEIMLHKLECQRAVFEFDIVRRLQNIFLRRRIQEHKDQGLVPVILRCFAILASFFPPALQMSKRPNLIHELYTMAEVGEHREASSRVLRTLTQHPQVIDYFIHETNWFNELSETLAENFMAHMDLDLLEHFSHFLELCPQMAIDRGFFEIILREISERQATQQVLLKCFAFLLNCKEGQDKLDKYDGVRILYEILMDESLKTYEYAIQALQSATAGSRISLWRCREFSSLPDTLIKRAHDKDNDRQQLYCLQTLRQITTVPSIKQYVQRICIPQLQSIECRKENTKKAKDRLLIWLKSDDFIDSDP